MIIMLERFRINILVCIFIIRIGKSVYYPSPEFGSDSRIFYLFVTPDGTTLVNEK